MELPRVRDANGIYSKRLHPLSCKISESMQPLSTVTMTVPIFDEVENFDWVEVHTPDGEIMYCQVASVSVDAENGEKDVYMEHGACLFDDIVIVESSGLNALSWTGTITQILTNIVSKQNRWTIGTVEATETIYIEPGGMSLMTAILTMMQSIPAYQVEFIQEDATNWHVDIKLRPTVAICEGRLGRNLKSCDVSYDASNVCTKVYCEGVSGGAITSQNANIYGIHEETMSLNSALSTAQKEAIVNAYLAAHDHPAVSISISGYELSQITGLAIDKFKLGTVCRIAIPWLGIVANEVIVDKKYADPFTFPEEVSFTLANEAPDLSIAIASVTGGGSMGGGGGGGKGGVAAERKRYETKFEKSDRHMRLIATDTEWDELGNGTLTAYGQLTVTSRSVQSVVSDIQGSGYSSITQLVDSISLLVDADGVATPATIIAAVNANRDTSVTISANEIDIDGILSVLITTLDTLVPQSGTISVTGNMDVGGNLGAGGLTLDDGYIMMGEAKLTLAPYDAGWVDKSVVTGVSVTFPSYTTTGRHSFAVADNDLNITGRYAGNLITGSTAGSVNPSTTTIHYLGR